MKEHLPIELFAERTQISLSSIDISIKPTKVVSLQDIKRISSIQLMSSKYLEQLLYHVVLEGDSSVRPYFGAQIQTHRIDPSSLYVGQTFAQWSKVRGIMERLGKNFKGFCISGGFAKCGPLIIYGETETDLCVMAHYLPPIVEKQKNENFLIDGVHRNMLTTTVGTTFESICIWTDTELPCTFKRWENVKLVDDKPPREERFWDLNKDYFRNLAWVGIDG